MLCDDLARSAPEVLDSLRLLLEAAPVEPDAPLVPVDGVFSCTSPPDVVVVPVEPLAVPDAGGQGLPFASTFCVEVVPPAPVVMLPVVDPLTPPLTPAPVAPTPASPDTPTLAPVVEPAAPVFAVAAAPLVVTDSVAPGDPVAPAVPVVPVVPAVPDPEAPIVPVPADPLMDDVPPVPAVPLADMLADAPVAPLADVPGSVGHG
jgi:hypothetical protein